MPQLRAGASTSRSGASACVPTSKRTWSLPFPVHPCATACALNLRAWSTRWRTMTGRESDDTSGYLPSYLAFAKIAFLQNSSAISSRASTITQSIAPDASARALMSSKLSELSASCPTFTRTQTTSTPHSSIIQRTATDVSSPPLYAKTTRLAMITYPSLSQILL